MTCRNPSTAIDAVLRSMYGADVAAAGGVVHVAAVWHQAAGRLITLAGDERAPRCLRDRFALEVARARADAIITTGRILRAEPSLRHDLAGPWAASLAAWRRDRLGKSRPPVILILTSGRDVPLAHPVFSGQGTSIIYTSRKAGTALSHAPARVVGVEQPSIHTAISYLQKARDCHTIIIEAGPSTARSLYQPPPQVNELMLSVLHAADLPATARGPAFLTIDEVRQVLPRASQPWPASPSPAGAWRFYRFTRDTGNRTSDSAESIAR